MCIVVDVKMTVRGYMELWGDEIEQARICLKHNPPEGTLAYKAGQEHLKRAANFRAKAYDLMGVNTIEQPAQLSFFEAL